MKLAKIRHLRCGESENATYIWVPDDMAEWQLEALVERSRQDCLDAERKVEGLTQPEYRTWWDFISKADENKTLLTIKAEYAAHGATYEQWAAKRDAARKSFAQRLVDLSGGEVKNFYEEDCSLEADCNWGHNHGTKVDYGETKL